MKRTCLLSVLGNVSPALAKNELIPQLTHFQFSSGHVCATNGWLFLRAPLEGFPECSMPAAPLLAFLSNTTAEDVVFTKDGGLMRCVAGRAKATIPVLNTSAHAGENFSHGDDGTMFEINQEFLDAIGYCSPVLAAHEISPSYAYLFVSGQDVFATTGVHLAHVRMVQVLPDLFLSKEVCNLLATLPFTTGALADGKLWVWGENIEFVTTMPVGVQVPEYERAFGLHVPDVFIDASDELRGVVDRAVPFSGGGVKKTISLEFSSNSLIVVGDAEGFGKFEESLPLVDGPACMVRVVPDILQRSLKHAVRVGLRGPAPGALYFEDSTKTKRQLLAVVP